MAHAKRLAALVVLHLTVAHGAAAQTVDLKSSEVSRGLESIRPEALISHVRFLADDLLEGRGTGTRGYDLAARYVATELEAAGVEPGADGKWYQYVPLRRSILVRPATSITVQRRGKAARRLVIDRDFVCGGDPTRAATDVSAPLVFCGFGVTAPELGYDDFAQVDPRGKIAVVLSGAPPTFPSDQRAHFSNSRTKDANLIAHGAVGILTVRTPVDERRAGWDRVVRQSTLPGFRWVEPDGRPRDAFPELRASATMHRQGAEALFAGAPRTLEQVFATADSGRPQGFPLPATASMRRRTRLADLASPNVVGLLRGTDPALRDQAVVYTAHLDHLGIGVPVAGDSIHNGAFDNATGVASLIEIARAFARTPPRRSVLFVAVTGEEKGLVGSDFFAENPTLPIGGLVADVNLDMFVMTHPLRDMIGYGAEHSTLGAVAARAVERLGLRLSPDPQPEEVIFVRSDQYSFVRRGVPAIFLVHGQDSGNPEKPGAEAMASWRRAIYHTPQDDLSQPMDPEGFARFAQAAYLIGHVVARQAERPAWKEGDFFGETFGPRPSSR